MVSGNVPKEKFLSCRQRYLSEMAWTGVYRRQNNGVFFWCLTGSTELSVFLPCLINEFLVLKKKKTTHLLYQSSFFFFFPLLLLDNDRKFLLPFLHAIVNFCRNSKGRIGFLKYELKRTTKELQFEIWDPTLRKVSMQLWTKLNIYLFLGLKAAAVTMKRRLNCIFAVFNGQYSSMTSWTFGSRTPSGPGLITRSITRSHICCIHVKEILSFLFFFLFISLAIVVKETSYVSSW